MTMYTDDCRRFVLGLLRELRRAGCACGGLLPSEYGECVAHLTEKGLRGRVLRRWPYPRKRRKA